MRGWPTNYRTRAQRRREAELALSNEEKENPNSPMTVCDILRDTEGHLFKQENAAGLRRILRPYLVRMSKRQHHDLVQLLQSHYGAGFLRAAGLLDGGPALRLVTAEDTK